MHAGPGVTASGWPRTLQAASGSCISLRLFEHQSYSKAQKGGPYFGTNRPMALPHSPWLLAAAHLVVEDQVSRGLSWPGLMGKWGIFALQLFASPLRSPCCEWILGEWRIVTIMGMFAPPKKDPDEQRDRLLRKGSKGYPLLGHQPRNWDSWENIRVFTHFPTSSALVRSAAAAG